MASVVPPTATRTKAESTATARVSKRNRGTVYGGKGSNNSDGNSSGGNGTGTKSGQQIDGVQPTWKNLHHPNLVATTPPTTIQQAGNIFSQVHNGELDVPHKILLTLLIIALGFTLLWCWRLFRAL